MQQERILILDFGGQYDQLIARRVREQRVYAEIKPHSAISVEEIAAAGYKGVIFTGGPNSVYAEGAPGYDPAILDLGVPVLGICYGAQLMAHMAGGTVSSAGSAGEYGRRRFEALQSPLFDGMPPKSSCWMSEVSENKPPVLSRTSFLFYYMNEKMHAFDVILFN